MMAFLAQNAGTILVWAILLLIVAAIVLWMVKNRKQGKSVTGGCGCGCENCAMSGHCHAKFESSDQ